MGGHFRLTIVARLKRLVKWLAIILVVVAALAFFGLTESQPCVAEPSTPDATLIGAGRDALRQVRHSGATPGQPITVNVTPVEREGLTALANQALGTIRVETAQSTDSVTISASKPLPLGRWLNITAITHGQGKGFPETQLTIGHLSLSPKWSRWVIDKAAEQARTRGIALPPLDQMVQALAIAPDRIQATIVLPSTEAGLAGLAIITGQDTQPLDPALIAQSYCALAKEQGRRPSQDFALHMRRAFALPRADAALVDHNRAALVALAMIAVGESIDGLAGEARAAVEKCRIDSPILILAGRDDLSRHWALSAGLAARMGPHMASSMGVWKELLDSLPQGSGFSFVDLAADRSGFRYAQAASDAERAPQVAARLATADAATLLPLALLHGPEGMSQQKWEERYTSTDAAAYEAAVAAIDTQLNAAGIP